MKCACIDELVENIGLDAMPGEHDIGLSEGQARRVAVARALLSLLLSMQQYSFVWQGYRIAGKVYSSDSHLICFDPRQAYEIHEGWVIAATEL